MKQLHIVHLYGMDFEPTEDMLVIFRGKYFAAVWA